MVKESEQTAFIPGCSVKDFFEIIYADASAARAYHKEVDKDENDQVESWQGNTRTVHFTMPMQLPAVLTKLVGGSAIPVKEVQVAETDGNGALCVTSTPLIGVPGGSKFQAVARLNVTNTATAGVTGCKVDALVTCTASGPWGLTSMIEGVMVEQSATSVQGYLTFCAARCTAALAEKATEGGGEGSESDATVFEQFFDAQEMLSRSTSLASHASERGPVASLTATEIDTLALVQLLDSLEGRLGLLASDLAAARALVKPHPSGNLAQSSRALHVPAKSSGLPLAGMWLLGLSCGVAGLYAFMKLRSRSAGIT